MRLCQNQFVRRKIVGGMEAHFKNCKHCMAVHDGTRDIVRLIGDGKPFQVPARFSSGRTVSCLSGSRKRVSCERNGI
jgi:hypothetical protein